MVVTDLEAGELEKVRGHRMRYFLPNRRPARASDSLLEPLSPHERDTLMDLLKRLT